MLVSIGIMAYNEESNIGVLLEALSRQVQETIRIEEIIVVASGCTDRTVSIVKAHSERNSKIKLIEQAQRQGKASAVNTFLEQAQGEILILESADTLPLRDTCQKLLAPFLEPQVGMAGAHPIPLNDPHHFIGYAAHFLWRLHHRLARHQPKLGEMVAFRNIIPQIPTDTAVDEASMEALISRQGLKLVYVPQALVFNKGPQTVADFLKQRRRIANGHLHLKHSQGYATSTLGTGLIWRVLGEVMVLKLCRLRRLFLRKRYRWLSYCLLGYARRSLWALGVIGLEAWARLLGGYDFHFAKRNPVQWEIARSTKKLSR